MLALLNDDHPRPHPPDAVGGGDEVVLPGEASGLLVVQRQRVDALQQRPELVGCVLDPYPHGVGRDEFRVRELVEDV